MRRRGTAGLVIVGLVVAACGGGAGEGEVTLRPLPVEDLDQADATVRALYGDLLGRLEVSEGRSAPERALAWGELGAFGLAQRYDLLADAALDNAHRLDPSSPRWGFLRARLASRRGDLETARELLLDRLERDREDAFARVLLAEVELDLGDVAVARDQLERALPPEGERGSGAARILGDLADIALREDRVERAVELYREALELQPEATSLRQGLAQAHRRAGKPDLARRTLAGLEPDALAKPQLDDPRIAELTRFRVGSRALMREARRLGDQGRWQEAAETYRRAIRSAPDKLMPRLALANALLVLGRPSEAIGELAPALEQSPTNSDALLLLGRALRRAGDRRRAWETAERALEADPRHAGVHALMAELRAEAGDHRAAAEHWSTVVELDPRDRRAREEHVRSLVAAGEGMASLRAVRGHREVFADDRALRHLEIRVLSAWPDDSILEAVPGGAERAVELARSDFEGTGDIASGEMLAMAWAAHGETQRAEALQRRIEEALVAAGRLDLLGPAGARREAYEASRRWTDPLLDSPRGVGDIDLRSERP